MGSVHYFSPEQARGENAQATSDIYSTGVVLYEMLTGRVPFDGDNPVAVAMQHLHAQPVPIQSLAPDVPQSVSNVCLKAMEKNPAMRYQSARDMAQDLRQALEERGERGKGQGSELEIKQPKPQFKEDAERSDPDRHGVRRYRDLPPGNDQRQGAGSHRHDPRRGIELPEQGRPERKPGLCQQ